MTSQASRLSHGDTVMARADRRLPVTALGMSLGLFIAITFALCVLFDALVPAWAMYPAWRPLFPGFVWFTWPGFFLGLAESFAYGWYVAVIFAPLYNFFVARGGRTAIHHNN